MICLPYPLVRRIHREQTVGSASIVPLLSLLANSHVWAMYGFLGRAWFPNFPAFLIGDIASWCYIFIYWKNSNEQRKNGQLIVMVVAVLAVPTLYVAVGFLGFTGQTRAEVWETHGLCFCDVTVISTSFFTLINIVRAFKNKSTASINVCALVVGTSYSSGWITYGHMTSNWIIAGPQVWIITLHLASWAMYIVFSRQNNVETSSVTLDEDDPVDLSLALPVGCNDNSDLKMEAVTSSEFQALSSPKKI
ncbi:hypothetical protein L915_14980 [Phytophthora nicotianae]|uniref:MtN3-like protein n=1 Tax=Phytophthora nicotianae TaxID=4792 RepID=W2G7Y0_PHYNI|nr:hypothetical protein L915_14980 [Phytophthora nicotianae]